NEPSVDHEFIYQQACLELEKKYEWLTEEKITKEVEKRTSQYHSTEAKRIHLEAKETYLGQLEKIKRDLESTYDKKLNETSEKLSQLQSMLWSKEKEWHQVVLEKEREKLQEQDRWQAKLKETHHHYELTFQEKTTECFQLKREKEDALLQFQKKELEVREILQKHASELQTARLESSQTKAEWLHRVKLQEAKLEGFNPEFITYYFFFFFFFPFSWSSFFKKKYIFIIGFIILIILPVVFILHHYTQTQTLSHSHTLTFSLSVFYLFIIIINFVEKTSFSLNFTTLFDIFFVFSQMPFSMSKTPLYPK
ncbi:hypothetical protein HMI54_009806, partial [Coelomomyces lativittatus]